LSARRSTKLADGRMGWNATVHAVASIPAISDAFPSSTAWAPTMSVYVRTAGRLDARIPQAVEAVADRGPIARSAVLKVKSSRSRNV
jgi:hypothetical protein